MDEKEKGELKILMDGYLRELVLQSHNQTASTTSHIMGEIAELKRDITEIKEGQEENNKALKDVKQALIEMDKRAVNWDLTTKIVYTLIGVIITAVIGALIGLVVI